MKVRVHALSLKSVVCVRCLRVLSAFLLLPLICLLLQKLMWVPLVILVPASLVSVSYIVEMVTERQEHMAARPGQFDWTYPRLSDLWVTFYGLVVLLFLRLTLCRFVFTPLGNRILPTVAEKKGKWTEAARADRVQRFSVCMFKSEKQRTRTDGQRTRRWLAADLTRAPGL
jgi:hypothetical protein